MYNIYTCYELNTDNFLVCSNFFHTFWYNGVRVILFNEVRPEYDTEEDLWLVLWPNIPVYPKKCIILNFLPMTVTANQDLFLAQLDNSPDTQIHAVVDYCQGNNESIMTSLMASRPGKFPGLNYQKIPYGFTNFQGKLYNDFKPNPLPSKDIDVLYYGSNSGRRMDYLAVIQEYCISIDKNYVYVPEFENEILKAEYLARSRIVISVASDDDLASQTNDLVKLSYLICGKNFFIAERFGDPLVESVLSTYTVYTSGVDEMCDKINYYLNERGASEIQDIVDTAYTNFQTDFDYGTNLWNVILPLLPTPPE